MTSTGFLAGDSISASRCHTGGLSWDASDASVWRNRIRLAASEIIRETGRSREPQPARRVAKPIVNNVKCCSRYQAPPRHRFSQSSVHSRDSPTRSWIAAIGGRGA